MAWKPGESGNPSGRPRDAGAARRIRDALTDVAPAAALTLAKAARAGDVKASVALLNYVLPALKATETPQQIKLAGKTLTAKASSVIAAMAAGEIGTGQAAELIGALSGMAKLAELDELIKRIELLEQAAPKRRRG